VFSTVKERVCSWVIDQLAVRAEHLLSPRVGNENRYQQMDFDRLVRCRLGCSSFTSQLATKLARPEQTLSAVEGEVEELAAGLCQVLLLCSKVMTTFPALCPYSTQL